MGIHHKWGLMLQQTITALWRRGGEMKTLYDEVYPHLSIKPKEEKIKIENKWTLRIDGVFHGTFESNDPLNWMREFSKDRFDLKGISFEGQTPIGYFFNISGINFNADRHSSLNTK